MCIVCALFEKEKITREEALKAFWEVIQTTENQEDVEHIQKAYATIDKAKKDPNQCI